MIVSGGKDSLSRKASLDAHSVIPHRQLGSYCSRVMTGLHKGTCIHFLGLLFANYHRQEFTFAQSGTRSPGIEVSAVPVPSGGPDWVPFRPLP